MNWSTSIITAFVLFALFIATLAGVCIREDISLVSSDYYREELEYQEQITRLENTASLLQKPVISVTRQQAIEIDFHEKQFIQDGWVRLFRPSDARLDRSFAIGRGEASNLRFPLPKGVSGRYRVKLQWRVMEKEYYIEEEIFI